MTKDREQLRDFTEEWIAVGDLEVDERIQREKLNVKKVERIIKNFNAGALGVLTVSRRNRVTNVILDGWHRWQAVKEITDNQGKILCHVYENLTPAEEAQLFLDLNAGNQPTLLEKFKARIIAQDPVAIDIARIIGEYGWKISSNESNSNIQCVGALERIYLRGVANDADPNYLQMAILMVTRAWEKDRDGVHAVVLEGLASLYAHTADLDLDRLISKLSNYPGGPSGLHTDATQISSLRRGMVSMAIAELVTDEYNKGKNTKRLPVWKRRRP